MTRNGKIARLSRQIRYEINQRLDDAEEAESILAWLNNLPIVQAMLEEQFDGAPISKQNLSEWRQGGFREWEFRRDLIEQACQASDSADDLGDEVITPLLAGKLASLLAARYAAFLNNWDGGLGPELMDTIYLLRGLNRDIALLQKTLHQAQKQQREYEKAIDEEEKWELEEEKKRETAPIMAKLEADRVALSLGGGEQAQKIADFLAAVKFDLPPPPEYRRNPAKPETGDQSTEVTNPKNPPSPPASRNPVKASQTETKAVKAKCERVSPQEKTADRDSAMK